MTAHFTPLLTTHDWNEEWKELQTIRRRKDDAAYWDERAKTFTTKDSPNPYVERFLELTAIRPGETVFDMGCGTGALALPLGAAGHKVVAADFSEGMLDQLRTGLAERAISGVTPLCMSWEDDWSRAGVAPQSADVCVASRSVATDDLREALLKLTNVARRRVCVTLATGSSPRVDERILHAIGLSSVQGRDHLYAFNILAQEGLKPELAYIESTREDTFDTREEALDSFSRMAQDATGSFVSPATFAAALHRLSDWVDANVVENERAGQLDKKGIPEKRLRLREPRVVTWAFISWNM